jgi:MoaA/NifB/PqqE/SkfB family radical SAM enzyme
MMKKPEIEIWFEAETRCNLSCKFCFNYWKDGSSAPPEQVSSERTLEALERIFGAFTCPKMTISGGEPLLREDLLGLVRFAVAHGTLVVLASNGTLLTEDKIKTLMQAGVATFEVSVHSVDSSVHDYLSGKSCWHQTIEAILRLRGAGANVVPVFVATAKNLWDFGSVLKMFSLVGIREFIFNRFIPTGLGILYKDEIGVPETTELIKSLVAANVTAGEFNATIHLGSAIELTAAQRKLLNRVIISSCPVATGQKRWTLDVAGNFRRCNQSGLSIGNVFSDGIDRITREMERTGTDVDFPDIRPCRILTSQLLTIQAAPLLS